MHTVRDDQLHVEHLSHPGTIMVSISRASKAQRTGLIRTEATLSGSNCGRRWPGSKPKTSGAKAPSLGF